MVRGLYTVHMSFVSLCRLLTVNWTHSAAAVKPFRAADCRLLPQINDRARRLLSSYQRETAAWSLNRHVLP